MSNLLKMMAGGAADPLYVDDVFSAYTYTGNGTTQTITNGIDLAGKGGLVWVKARSGTIDHTLTDTVRGNAYELRSSTTSGQNYGTDQITSFNSNGFTTGNGSGYNFNTYPYVSWTFRKAPKFFDVVTYTGDGANRTIAHSLGDVPGMIIVKRTDVAGSWMVYHRSLTSNAYNLVLNTTAAEAFTPTAWNSTTATASVFSLGTHADVNTNTGTYVAYLFAHDTSATGLIQCGSFTTDGSGNATVNLGWEPQYLMAKRIDLAENWFILDTIRGFDVSGTDKRLAANTSAAEVDAPDGNPTAAGFNFGESVSATYIYLAIRRPNKPPTLGTEVYNAIARTGTGAAATVTGVGFAPDLALIDGRSSNAYGGTFDRLRGSLIGLNTTSTAAEVSYILSLVSYDMDGISLGSDTNSEVNVNTRTYINWFFRRAPGVFDVVCWTNASNVNQRVAHNLGVVPELIITKTRDIAGLWYTYASLITSQYQYIQLSTTNAVTTNGSMLWGTSAPTTTDFGTNNTGTGTGYTTNNQVAYLFATKAGISKVGSYTGNGSSQTINCGFTTGARFVLIKRTDSTGDWYVWDTIRGIIAGDDPHLSLNSTAAEITNDDSVDPDSAGFIVNQLAATNINVSAATYIYLSFA